MFGLGGKKEEKKEDEEEEKNEEAFGSFNGFEHAALYVQQA